MYSAAPMRRVRGRQGDSFWSERMEPFRSGAVARGFLLLATGLLCSVSGVTENREESRSIIYSDWQEWTAAESSEAVANRVGSFRVGRPESEKFIGGLFDEWREIILPEFGRVDPLLRQGVRDKLFLNQESVDFNEYLRGRQADLLLRLNRASADYLTGSLTERAEAGAGRYSFVRNVEWDYQSKLGERRWQTGLNVVGALRETAADAIVWQLRGYAAKDSSGGANVGLIYRRVVGEGSLAGANVFLDYEDHDYGSFSRWSLGGEVRGGWGGVFVNRYMVLSGDRKLSDGRTAYSRDGFDVATEFRVPKFRWVSGGLTYYRFDGEHGDADEKGFRYHGAFDFSELMGGGDFWGGLSFALEYDNGSGGDWGGKISYRYAFDAATPSGASGTAESFDPRAHFFDPVRREYAQRISRSKTGGGPPTTPDGTPILDAMATVVAGTASFAFDTGGTVSVGAPMTVMAGGSVVAYKSTATVDIRTEADSMVSVATSPWWAVRVFEGSGVRFSDEGRRLSLSQGTVSVSRSGYLREIRTQALIIGLENQANLAVGHPNRVNVATGDLSISLGVTVATAGEVKNAVDLLMATDEAMVRIHSPALTVTVNGVVRFASGMIRLPVERGRTGSLAVLSPTGGYREGYRYEVVGATALSVNQAGVVSFVGASGIDADSTLVVQVSDDFSQPATATVIFEARTSLVVASTPATVFVRPTDAVGSPILTLTVSGGKGAYAWRVSGDGVAMAAGVVSFTRAGADGEVRRVVLLVSDDDGFQTVSRNLAVVFDEGIKVSGGGLRVAEDYQGVVHTVAASSQRGTVSFSSGTPGVAVDGTGGGVSLASTLAVGSDLVVTITVDAFRGGERVDHTVVLLTLAGVSVFVPRSPGILYAMVGAAAGEVLGALSVGSVFGEVADPDDWVSVNAGSGAIHLRTAASSAGTVMVTLFAGDGAVGNNRPVVVTIFFYEPVAVVSPSDPYIVRAAVGRVHHTITPSGGSGLYNYEVVSPASGVALLSPSRSASSDVSVVVGISVTLEAVIRVSDARIAANPAVLTTLRFFGTERLSFGTFARRHYVPVGAAASVTLVSLLAVSGVEPYRFSEADANFAIESGSVLIFTGSSGSPTNYSAEVVVTDGDSPPETATVRVEVSVYTPLSVSPAAATHTISAGRTGAVHTVTATAGSGTYGYATETMPTGHGVRMADNVLQLTEGVDGYLTVNIRVSEAGVGYGGEEATQRVVLRGVPPLRPAMAGTYEVSPDYTGVVTTLSVSGGMGSRTYRRVSGTTALMVNSSGEVSLATALATEGSREIAVFEVRDGRGDLGLFTLSLRVAVVEAMYLIGGLYSDTPNSRSNGVWRSTNGADWTRIASAPFSGRGSYQAVSHDGSLWVIGGVDDGGNVRNDVWRSADGVNWVSVAVSGRWFSRRYGHQAVSHGGSLWVIGGDEGGERGKNDIWRSADGVNWVSVAVSGRWFSPRLFHQAVSHGGSLWVLAGGSRFSLAEGDVWASADGMNWRQVLAAFRQKRHWGHQAVSHGGSLWVMGGFDPFATIHENDVWFHKNDVWRSAGGRTWTQVTGSAAFSRRQGHQAVSYRGSLWVVGGGNPFGRDTYKNDVWRSADGRSWTQVTGSADFSGRRYHQVVVHRPPVPAFVREI